MTSYDLHKTFSAFFPGGTLTEGASLSGPQWSYALGFHEATFFFTLGGDLVAQLSFLFRGKRLSLTSNTITDVKGLEKWLRVWREEMAGVWYAYHESQQPPDPNHLEF